ncbi:MAG TPA: tetratricopeptide repeat-containing glycosyltransferase family protein [Xanthobacteraceae bacterium]|jgi:tetratricopeptide (TPR) repeat protein
MAGADDKLILPGPDPSDLHATTVEMSEAREDDTSEDAEDQAEPQPLAAVAPGLALTPIDAPGQSPIEALAGAPAPDRKPLTVIDKLNKIAVENLEAGDYQRALDALRRVLNLMPDSPAAHGNLALALWRNKSAPQAEIHCRRALALDRGYVAAHRILAELLRERNAPDALAAYDQLLTLDPASFMTHNNRGLLLNKLGRRRDADASFARALEIVPDNPHVRFNQLMVQPDGDLAEARDCCLRALAERPDNPDIMTNLAIVLQFAGRYDEARAQYERVLSIVPDHLSALFNLSLLLLLQGEYPRGWTAYESRWRLPEMQKQRVAATQWQGEDLHGKTILLHAEQGHGDTILALRYIPAILARGARVALRIERPLVRLAASLPGDLIITPTKASSPAFDVWSPLLDLPRILDTRIEAIPADVPYLHVRPAIAERWRQRLSHSAGLKVGLVWAGSPSHVNDFRRSIELERLKPLLDVNGTSFVSLQVGPRAADASNQPGAITDISAALTDFAETAGAILNLDLVIAVDTAVVHLAGALDRPAWVMLPFSPDWRWLLDRDDSPWYPALRLYRQPQPGDWSSVITRVAADLRARVARGGA